ncbi:MAG: threonine synthase [Ottowia sp.]|nr:threonine synthase [Ottowia sp.]
MRYFSTRDSARLTPKTFSDILLAGLADDGGLFLPESYPRVTLAELAQWRQLSYAELAAQVLGKFAPDIAQHDIAKLCAQTYTADNYSHIRKGQDASQIAPLQWLGEESGTRLGLLCLSHGPTLAFKDMAMQLLGKLFEYTLAARNQTINILGATSGDTGSAAEYAMRGKRGIRVFMLSPRGKMSAFQTAQMFSLQDPNIFNIAVDGVFDQCQDMVKAVSGDAQFKSRYQIGTVNSINWARIVAQVVYYFKGYFAATTDNAQKVSFAVPTGNFGNVCAGHIARMMGLPIAQLVVATNENDVLDEFFRRGVYRARSAAQTMQTSSPSMDIAKASNLERFIADLFLRDGARVTDLFAQLAQQSAFDISSTPEFARMKEYGFVSGHSTHAQRLATVRDIAKRYHWVIDPHTADGLSVARAYLQPGIPMIVLETALPAKFSLMVQEALGVEPECPANYRNVEQLPQRFTPMAADVDAVKQFLATHITQ